MKFVIDKNGNFAYILGVDGNNYRMVGYGWWACKFLNLKVHVERVKTSSVVKV